MQKILLFSLSIFGLVGYSSFVHGAYRTSNFKGDCMEMRCQYGCSENTETGEGHCCAAPRLASCVAKQVKDGCVVVEKKNCPAGTECLINSDCPSGKCGSNKICCPVPTSASCVAEQVENGCVVVEKKDCPPNVECLIDSDCPAGKTCGTEGICCAAPTSASCVAEQVEKGCVVVEKKDCPPNVECLINSDCPDLHTYCSNNKCVPCNQEGTGLRPTADAEYCDCPEGYTKRCGSLQTTINCVDGASWTCKAGCYDNTDCQTDEYCSCNGKACPAQGGTCQHCPEGTHRAATSATQCVPCAGCQEWDETAQACVSTCNLGQLCLQNSGTKYPYDYNKCRGDACMTVPDRSALIHKVGKINGRSFYFPPAQNQYKMTHTSASRFCEHYGMHLATVIETCSKDYSYDTGYDCPNFVEIKTFTDQGRSYNLSSWNVDGMGSFWLADLSGNEALRVTWSCGNNHSTAVCNQFYPLCTNN